MRVDIFRPVVVAMRYPVLWRGMIDGNNETKYLQDKSCISR
jgi:hypothetical protein